MAKVYEIATGREVPKKPADIKEQLNLMEKRINQLKKIERSRGLNSTLKIIHTLQEVPLEKFKQTLINRLYLDLEQLLDELYIRIHNDGDEGDKRQNL